MNELPLPLQPVAVVIPIRSFDGGKLRLATEVPAATRVDLVRRMAERVVEAAAGAHVVVVTSAPEVEQWARARHLDVLADPGSLDGAAAAGRAHARELGLTRTIVAHADLPFARSLANIAADGALPRVTVVPCHRDDGTPVLSVPSDVEFRFAYGAGSFRAHVAEARRLGLAVRVVRDPTLAFDVDVPGDVRAVLAEQST